METGGVSIIYVYQKFQLINQLYTQMKTFRTFFTLFILATLFYKVANIVACPSSDPLNLVYCSCNSLKFSIAGKCIFPQSPCQGSYLTYIYNEDLFTKRFNLWNSTIAGFWDLKLQDVKKTQTFSSPLPTFLNDFNFLGMELETKRGWTQAYYLYQGLKKDIQSLTVSNQNKLIFNAINAAKKFQTLNNIQIWKSMKDFYNLNFQKSLTLQQFTDFIDLNVKPFIPCHDCVQNLGPVPTSTSAVCQLCPPNCQTCSQSVKICDACIKGFYLDGPSMTCEACTLPDCDYCSEDGSCSKCSYGKVLKDGACVTCSDSCVQCTNNDPSYCIQCNSLQFSEIASEGKCVVCDQKECSKCDTDDTSICLICSQGYYTDQNYVCQKCSSNCIGCSKTKCYSCDYGYGLVEGVCQPCKNSSCLICDDNVNFCSKCMTPAFQLNQNTNLCQVSTTYTQKCREGCDICYDNTQFCFKCSERFFYQDNVCKKCTLGCLSCNNPTSCLKCDKGYVLKDQKCVKCPDRCRQCNQNDPTICINCFERYIHTEGKCIMEKNKQCMFFDDILPSTCLMCKPGYTLSPKGDCVRCAQGKIWTCNSKNFTQSQQSRFQLNHWYFNQYNLGLQGCYIQVGSQCLEPDNRYKIIDINGTFYAQYKCLHPCVSCNPNNLTACVKCVDNYQLKDGLCVPKLQCNPTCTSCPQGSQRNSKNVCQLCTVANCATCLNNKCINCHEGFYLSQDSCKRCPAKCKSCYDADNCNQCTRGYVKPAHWTSLQGQGDCVLCDPSCLTCRFQQTICTSCQSTKVLLDNRCVYPKQLRFSLKFNMTPQQFLSKSQNQAFLDDIAAYLGVDPTYLFIDADSLKPDQNGNTIVKGFIPQVNDTVGINHKKDLDNKLPNNQIGMLDSNYTLLNQSSSPPCPNCTNPNGTTPTKVANSGGDGSIGPWIWIVAGIILGLITFITAGWAIYKYNKRQREKQMQGAAVPSAGSQPQNPETDQYISRGIPLV